MRAGRQPIGHALEMPPIGSRRLRPEDLLTTADEARSYLWSTTVTLISSTVVAGGWMANAAAVSFLAFPAFMGGAIAGNLFISRVAHRLHGPKSGFRFYVLRSRIGFALWSPAVLQRALKLTRSSGDD